MGRSAKVIRVLCFAAVATVACVLPAAEPRIVGRQFDYTVRRGDTFASLGARFAVSAEALARRNGLSPRLCLRAGRVLRVDNRHIVPAVLENGILINVPQRLLFYFENGRLESWYPVALGQPGSWQTPTGSYEVVSKEMDPVWDVPVSIQEEMRRKGEKVQTTVEAGPDNPLGRYWLGLSLTCCGIHSTNSPGSIYGFPTHGCIRLAPDDAVDLFSRASVGTPVEIVYETVLLARVDGGTSFVEVHPDVYGREGGPYEKVRSLAEIREIRSASETPEWEETVRRAEGIAFRLRASSDLFGEAGPDRIREPAAALRK
jgi:L,D-transpeptidase ErfK/SrfK